MFSLSGRNAASEAATTTTTGDTMTTTTTAVAVAPMTTEAAEAITADIKSAGKALVTSRTKFAKAVKDAKEGQAYVALGMLSWTEYIASVFEDMPGLGKGDKEYLTAFMAEQGMSSRAVARVLNVSPSTAARMIKQAEAEGKVDPDRKIEGKDGKAQSKGKGKGKRGPAKVTAAEKPDADADADTEVQVSQSETPEVESVEPEVVDTETVTVEIVQPAMLSVPNAPFSVKGADTHALRNVALQILAELADRFGAGDVAAELALMDISDASVTV